MKDQHGDIIYVGKAKKLKNRVSSYFVGAHDYKTTKMVSQVVDFDIIITSTEKESLILEINLIKEHRPRFNILFMDDKSYPYLKVSRSGKPEVIVSRDRKHRSDAIYFGPYPDATAAREMAKVLNESTPNASGELLPNTQAIYDKFNRTTQKYSEEAYTAWRQQIVAILNGNSKVFRDALQTKMEEASMNMQFELAQSYKEKLDAIHYISDKQQVQFDVKDQFDLFAYQTHQGYIAIVGLFVRAGRLLERSMAIEASLEDPEDALMSFITQFYQNQPLPKQIYVPISLSKEPLEAVLNHEVLHPHRGKKRALMEIAEKNAQQQLDDQFEILKQRQGFKDQALAFLGETLDTNHPIHRIEIFDNSHISGSFAVSACVVFDDGEPNKSQYRKYKLSTGNDDAASMREVVYRRYLRILKEAGTMPDLILVDGGIQQVHAAQTVLNSLDLQIPLCGLVKDDRHRTHALLKEDGTKIILEPGSALFAMMTQMQDEVHRFVINFHRSLRKKAMTKSILEEVSGLGPKRQKALYAEFKSLKGMREASVESLARIIPLEVAQELHDVLHIDWEEYREKN